MSQFHKSTNNDYKKIDLAIKENQIGNCYIFFGDEHYLRDHYIEQLRVLLCPDGADGFNYKRFEGADLSLNDLDDAINTFPAFAERTLIEIHDYDLFNIASNQLPVILSNLPEYVCVLFVYNTIAYKPDKRTKFYKQLSEQFEIIEYAVQTQNDLFRWMTKHYMNIGKSIGRAEAEYLIHITGGYMNTIKNEIEKTAAHSKGDRITREDIDAVVVPVLDAVVYQLSNAIVKCEHVKAMRILDELFRMREAPQKLIYHISMNMRQLLAACVCIENKYDKAYFKEMCGINFEFQAKMIFDTARKSTIKSSRQAVIDCAEAAYDLNSSPDPESRLIELVTRLALPD